MVDDKKEQERNEVVSSKDLSDEEFKKIDSQYRKSKMK